MILKITFVAREYKKVDNIKDIMNIITSITSLITNGQNTNQQQIIIDKIDNMVFAQSYTAQYIKLCLQKAISYVQQFLDIKNANPNILNKYQGNDFILTIIDIQKQAIQQKINIQNIQEFLQQLIVATRLPYQYLYIQQDENDFIALDQQFKNDPIAIQENKNKPDYLVIADDNTRPIYDLIYNYVMQNPMQPGQKLNIPHRPDDDIDFIDETDEYLKLNDMMPKYSQQQIDDFRCQAQICIFNFIKMSLKFSTYIAQNDIDGVFMRSSINYFYPEYFSILLSANDVIFQQQAITQQQIFENEQQQARLQYQLQKLQSDQYFNSEQLEYIIMCIQKALLYTACILNIRLLYPNVLTEINDNKFIDTAKELFRLSASRQIYPHQMFDKLYDLKYSFSKNCSKRDVMLDDYGDEEIADNDDFNALLERYKHFQQPQVPVQNIIFQRPKQQHTLKQIDDFRCQAQMCILNFIKMAINIIPYISVYYFKSGQLYENYISILINANNAIFQEQEQDMTQQINKNREQAQQIEDNLQALKDNNNKDFQKEYILLTMQKALLYAYCVMLNRVEHPTVLKELNDNSFIDMAKELFDNAIAGKIINNDDINEYIRTLRRAYSNNCSRSQQMFTNGEEIEAIDVDDYQELVKKYLDEQRSHGFYTKYPETIVKPMNNKIKNDPDELD